MSFDIANDILLGIKDLCEKLGTSKSTLNRIRRNDIPGQTPFPEPTVWLGHGNSPRWSAKSINVWVYNQGQSYRNRKFNQENQAKMANIENTNEATDA
ncbi:hypothetical protein [Providencia sneebia]|uniref:Uncharacterized protein n=1 Tax=Providencia sneebia DSM 19967 TaxID=1141660 RepID=K8W7Z5_9GAMM|nr:hypothetical protein [Providencia sneebia]EKT53597.1 hypothetical protein OO7_15344 [Providencia sneebia DSM 19967]